MVSHATGYNVMIMVRVGSIYLVKERMEVEEHSLLIFERSGGAIALRATQADTHILLLAGEPIDEVRTNSSNDLPMCLSREGKIPL